MIEQGRVLTMSREAALRYEYPHELVPEGETAASYLRKEAYIGAHWRYPNGIPANVQEQLEHELDIIGELQFEGLPDSVRHCTLRPVAAYPLPRPRLSRQFGGLLLPRCH